MAALDRPCAILTRNTTAIAHATLRAVGLDDRFDPVVGRDAAPPKPSPAGIERILEAWGARADDAVMVGDFRLDLEAGRAAGVATVLVDPTATAPWGHLADVRVSTELGRDPWACSLAARQA